MQRGEVHFEDEDFVEQVDELREVPRATAEERSRMVAVSDEGSHLVHIPDVVLVPKPNGTWRMCIDYTSLNKACPKDPFALPRIDQVTDSTAG